MQVQPGSTYVMNELAFDVDEPLADKTMHRLELGTSGGRVAIVVCRRPQPRDVALADAVEQQLVREQGAVLGFTRIDLCAARVAGREAIETRVRYRAGEADGYQVDLHAFHGGVWFRIGATTLLTNRDAADACLTSIAASLVFRDGELQ